MTIASATLETPIGAMTVVASDAGLRAVLLPGDGGSRPEDAVEDHGHPLVAAASVQLGEYFAGERVAFDLPLDPVGTEFQRAVWQSLADIPFGETVTYGQQADRIGRPTATRAVGAANGRNPLPIVLPCHRVIGADGSLTGYAGGIDTKRFLLDHEAHVLAHRRSGEG